MCDQTPRHWPRSLESDLGSSTALDSGKEEMPEICLFYISHSTFIDQLIFEIVLPYKLSQVRSSEASWESMGSGVLLKQI